MAYPGVHPDRETTLEPLSATRTHSGPVIEIPLASYQNIVKFLRRAHDHRPNRDVLWCIQALDDYAPTRE